MCEELNNSTPKLSKELEQTLTLFNKLSNLASNFFDKSPNQIAKESTGLSLSPSMLAICRSFFGSKGITDRELFVLEAYANAISHLPAHYSPETLLVNEPYIAEAYGDMMKKYAALHPDYDRPCNIEKMLRIGGEAVSIGLPRQFSSTDLRVVTCKKDTCSKIRRLLSGLEDVESFDEITVCRRVDAHKFREKVNSTLRAVTIYSPDNEEALLELCRSLRSFKPYKITVGKPCEIFIDALNSFTGVQLSTDSLPIPTRAENMPSEYRSVISASDTLFTENVFGSCVIFAAGKPSRIKKLTAKAQKLGLCTSDALQPQNLRLFSILSPKSPPIKFKSDLYKMLFNMSGSTAKIPAHSPEIISKSSYGVERIFESDNKRNTVYSVSLKLSDSPAPFNETVFAISELMATAVKDGYSIKNGLITLSASASLSLSTSEDLGRSIASILGVYRAITSLGLPMEDTSAEITEDETKITLVMRAFSNEQRSPLASDIPAHALVFDSLDENLLPNFDDILSKFCRGECFPVSE